MKIQFEYESKFWKEFESEKNPIKKLEKIRIQIVMASRSEFEFEFESVIALIATIKTYSF